MTKDVIDALHMLLHCSLKDKECTTQKEQFKIVSEEIEYLEDYNEVLLEKLMFALRPTDHMLDEVTKDKFKQIISENLDLETVKIKEKLKLWWESGKYEGDN